jgi:hypothetical protein
MGEFLYLNIDEVIANLSFFTQYEEGGDGRRIVVAEANLTEAIDEIVGNFAALVENSFYPCDEDEDEEEEN